MRVVDIEGTKAQYLRVSLLRKAKDYGQNLTPGATAPFTVRWCDVRKAAGVFLDETLLAVVDTEEEQPKLVVNDSYPERYDFALKRALRNAVEVCDAIGKMKRTENRQEKKRPLCIKNAVMFRVEGTIDDVRASVLGLQKDLPDLRFVDDKDGESLFYAQGYYAFVRLFQEDGFVRMQPDPDGSGFDETAMRAALIRGKRVWEAFSPQEFVNDVRALMSEPEFDEERIWELARNASLPEHTAHLTEYRSLSYKDGSLSIMSRGIPVIDRLFFEGQPPQPPQTSPRMIARFAEDGVEWDAQAFLKAARIMAARHEAEKMGLDTRRFPKPTEALITKLIEETDFGYG